MSSSCGVMAKVLNCGLQCKKYELYYTPPSNGWSSIIAVLLQG